MIVNTIVWRKNDSLKYVDLWITSQYNIVSFRTRKKDDQMRVTDRGKNNNRRVQEE